MIPVDREPGPWSKYLHREIQAGKDGGYKCEKCSELFPSYHQLASHSCPVELQEKINQVRKSLGNVNIELHSGINSIDSYLCVGSLKPLLSSEKTTYMS